MLRAKDLAKLYRVVLHQAKPLQYVVRGATGGPYGQDPRPFQDPLRRKDREACPLPPPPPPPPPKDDTLLWSTIAAVCVTAAFCVAAKSNEELRDWVTIYVPWFDDVIAVVFQENMSYLEFAARTVEDTRRLFRDYVEDTRRGTPKECSLEEKPENYTVIEPKEEIKGDCDKSIEEKDKPVCEIIPPPVLTLDITEVERCLKELGETMLLSYLNARDACRLYNKTVEDALNNYSQAKIEALQSAEDDRRRLVKESLSNVEEAKCKLEQLAAYLSCGVKCSQDEKESVCEMVKNMKNNIERIKTKYIWEHDKSVVMDDEWKMVKEAVDQYMRDNEALIPGLQYSNPKSKMQGDLDLLLHHSSRLVQKMTEDLEAAADAMTQRIDQAIAALPYNPNRCEVIKAATEKKQAQLAPRYKKLLQVQRNNVNENCRKILEHHRCSFEAQLEKRLCEKQASLEEQLDQMVAEQVIKERKKMKLDLTNLGEKLRRVEEQLNARLKAESEARRSQELWTASVSLLAATKKGTPRVCVKKELSAIEKAAGDNDELVMAVLSGIPASVRDDGLVPESVLKRRYKNMEAVALKVAMVEVEGGPLPVYAMSWIQSFFLFMKMRSIPVEEMGEKSTDPVSEDLDTFDLLQRASYYMDRGELSLALRYVSALQGASRGAAHGWLQDARAHLAARQAADALLAHAHSLAIKHI